jgi:DNA polymerase
MGLLRVMVVGEAPGYHEDQQGKGFVGRAGQLLWTELRGLGIDRSILHVYNAIACRPADNQFPGLPYINKCPWLTEGIQKAKPVSILCLGNRAMFYFRSQATGITEMNGKTEWSQKANAWVTYCLHPSNALRDDGANLPAFRNGLKEFVRVLSEIS